MEMEYDQKADAMYIRLKIGTIAESNEVLPGVIFDFDADDNLLGIEMLDISERTDSPHELIMELVGA